LKTTERNGKAHRSTTTDGWAGAAELSHNDPDAERQLVGGIFGDPEQADAIGGIAVDAVTEPSLKLLLGGVYLCRQQGVVITPAAVADALRGSMTADAADALRTLAEELRDAPPTATPIPALVERLTHLSFLREVHATGPWLQRMAKHGGDLTEIVRQLETKTARWKGGAGTAADGPVLQCVADIEPRAIPWLWRNRIALGRITLLAGRPGDGKSFAALDLAARITTETPFPDGTPCPKGSVIVVNAEDDPNDVIRPRLDALQADVRKIHLLSAVRSKGKERMVTLADIPAIEAALQRHKDCRLLIVDPLGSFLGGKMDQHRENETRAALGPIGALAMKYGPAALIVVHYGKGARSLADDLVLGSRGITGIARAVWHVTRDVENRNRRLFLPGKNNLAAEGDGLAFAITGEPPRVVWEADPISLSADDALALENDDRKPGPDATAQKAAREWLRAALAGGERLARELFSDWTDQGGAEKTLRRAQKALNIVPYRKGYAGPSWWKLPRALDVANLANDYQGEKPGQLGHLWKNTGETVVSDGQESQMAKLSDVGQLGVGPDPFDDQNCDHDDPPGALPWAHPDAPHWSNGRADPWPEDQDGADLFDVDQVKTELGSEYLADLDDDQAPDVPARVVPE